MKRDSQGRTEAKLRYVADEAIPRFGRNPRTFAWRFLKQGEADEEGENDEAERYIRQ
jgi:hypothetical protein